MLCKGPLEGGKKTLGQGSGPHGQKFSCRVVPDLEREGVGGEEGFFPPGKKKTFCRKVCLY